MNRFRGKTLSPRNENLNLLVRIKFFNLFLNNCVVLKIKTEKFTGPNKIYWSWARGPVLIVRTACYFHWTWNGTILSALKSNNSHKRYNFRIMATMFLSNQDEMRKSYKGPSIDTSCRISLYLAKRFHQWRTWKSTNQKKNGLHVYWPIHCTDSCLNSFKNNNICVQFFHLL